MARFVISACGSEALETKEIEANTIVQAIEEYQDLWERGLVKSVDYEFAHFTATHEDGKEEIINY